MQSPSAHPVSAPDRLELGFETGLQVTNCDGCRPGGRVRATGFYRTAPSIPIALGAGIEHARFRHTHDERYDTSDPLTSQVQQTSLQLLARYYLWSEPLGSTINSGEGWIDLGVGYDGLSSDRSAPERDCERNAAQLVGGAGGGYRLAHNALIGVQAGFAGRLWFPSRGEADVGYFTPSCRSIPEQMNGTTHLSLLSRISF